MRSARATEARGVLGDAFAFATRVSCSAHARWSLGQGSGERERPSRARCCHAAVLDLCFLGAACRYQGAPGALPGPLNELDLGSGSASTSSNNAFVALSRLVRELLFALTSLLYDAARPELLATPCVPGDAQEACNRIFFQVVQGIGYVCARAEAARDGSGDSPINERLP
jgi:hypothetical protein